MIRILRFLITGDWHLHKWKTLQSVECEDGDGSVWSRYYCKCEICGKHRKFD